MLPAYFDTAICTSKKHAIQLYTYTDMTTNQRDRDERGESELKKNEDRLIIATGVIHTREDV